MSKLRVRHKQDKRRIEALEQRIVDLIGMNDELEQLLVEYEDEKIEFNSPWSARLDKYKMDKKIFEENYNDF
tara:strand:+ start:348 stop:563 length:216 start_codon:yes stop_codon:yes gene_type:complete